MPDSQDCLQGGRTGPVPQILLGALAVTDQAEKLTFPFLLMPWHGAVHDRRKISPVPARAARTATGMPDIPDVTHDQFGAGKLIDARLHDQARVRS